MTELFTVGERPKCRLFSCYIKVITSYRFVKVSVKYAHCHLSDIAPLILRNSRRTLSKVLDIMELRPCTQ